MFPFTFNWSTSGPSHNMRDNWFWSVAFTRLNKYGHKIMGKQLLAKYDTVSDTIARC